MNNIFLTGPTHIGKSTIIRKILSQLQSYRVGGFFTVPIYQNSQIIGYQIRSLSNRTMVFARAGCQGVYQVSRFGIFPEAFEKIGAPALAIAFETSQLIVMDEIGTMEQGASKFRQQILRCLDSQIPVLGVIQPRPNCFLDAIRDRNDMALIYVNESNRTILPNILTKKILSILQN